MSYVELKNGTIIIAEALEIIAFPKSEHINEIPEKAYSQTQLAFANLLSEFHNIASTNSTVLEILWLPEKTENQTFLTKPRAFVIIRCTGSDLQNLKNRISMISTNIFNCLIQAKYDVTRIEPAREEFIDLLRGVSRECHSTVIKKERLEITPFSKQPFYSWDIFDHNTEDSMSSFLAAFSQCENTAVSFQIIPTVIYPNERQEINFIINSYVQQRLDINDTGFQKRLKNMEYVYENVSNPVFYYNISLFGTKEACLLLSTKLVSLIESGQEQLGIEQPFTCNISDEKISLSGNFYAYPWTINSFMLDKYRCSSELKNEVCSAQLVRMPFLAFAEELNTFFRFPIYDKSMPELKAKQNSGESEQFVTDISGEDTIKIGNLVTADGKIVSIGAPYKSWTQHALIVGMPGTGKTTFAVNILTQFAKKDIPFLAIEPTKAEYRAMIDAVDGLQIFTPGNNSVSPFIINPFIPPIGITIEQYIPSLLNAFKAAFSMDGPLEMLFLKAVNACYVKYGWKQNSRYKDPGTQVFGMYEYILCFKSMLERMNYNKDTRNNLETAGLLRLMNLIEQNANIYDSVHTVPIEDLLKHSTVIELNSIENEEQKALIISLLLSTICIYTKINQKGDGKLKNIILIDEAHVLLDAGADGEFSGKSKSTTVKTIQKMIAEIRSYGTGIIIADQKPTKVTDDIVANTNIKIAFRLSSPVERRMIAESTDMSANDSEQLSHLSLGQAYVHFDKLMSPQLVQCEDTRKRDHIRLSVDDMEIVNRMKYWDEHKNYLIPFRECDYTHSCKTCSFKIRNDAEFYASQIFYKYSDKFSMIINETRKPQYKDSKNEKECTEEPENASELFLRFATKVAVSIEKMKNSYSDIERRRLSRCVVIRLLRKIQIEYPISFTSKQYNTVLSFTERKKQ